MALNKTGEEAWFAKLFTLPSVIVYEVLSFVEIVLFLIKSVVGKILLYGKWISFLLDTPPLLCYTGLTVDREENRNGRADVFALGACAYYGADRGCRLGWVTLRDDFGRLGDRRGDSPPVEFHLDSGELPPAVSRRLLL